MANPRGYDPATEVSPTKIPKVMQNEAAGVGNSPSVEPSETQVRGRGADTPQVFTGGQNTKGGLSGISVEAPDAQVRGRGADTPKT